LKTFERLPPMDRQWQKYKDATEQSLYFYKTMFCFYQIPCLKMESPLQNTYVLGDSLRKN